MTGIDAARGKYVLMADADASYDFGHLPRFLARLDEGNDLVMGNRFRGEIKPGAMPPLHKYLGNPVLSFIGRLFFRIPVGDFHCGIRAMRRDSIVGLDLQHNRHGVRQRDGRPFLARQACASPRSPPRSHPTAAPAPRTCAPGATVGVTCASFCSTARAGSFFYPGIITFLVGLVLSLWLLRRPAHRRPLDLRRRHPHLRARPRPHRSPHLRLRCQRQSLRHPGRLPSARPEVRTYLSVTSTLETGLVFGCALLLLGATSSATPCTSGTPPDSAISRRSICCALRSPRQPASCSASRPSSAASSSASSA